MGQYMNTREVSKYLGINEKKVYSLIEEKKLPATKITGKWGFFKEMVDQWLENGVENHPSVLHKLKGFLMVAGSNDPLLDFTLGEMERVGNGLFPFFCNTGSLEGLSMLRDRKVHIAGSHILDEEEGEYNIPLVASHFAEFKTVVVNFAYRQQGLILGKGNPMKIKGIEDLGRAEVSYINRQKGSGTRVLIDSCLNKLGVDASKIKGYETEVSTHLDVGLRILRGEADAGAGIRATAQLLGLDFIPLKEERFDLLIPRDYFFLDEVQRLMEVLKSGQFRGEAGRFGGYDIRDSGKVIYTC